MKLFIMQFLHSPVTTSIFNRNILLSTLFSNTPNLCSSHNVRDQVSHPYRTTGKTIVLFRFDNGHKILAGLRVYSQRQFCKSFYMHRARPIQLLNLSAGISLHHRKGGAPAIISEQTFVTVVRWAVAPTRIHSVGYKYTFQCFKLVQIQEWYSHYIERSE
jgi:hypothetical protein